MTNQLDQRFLKPSSLSTNERPVQKEVCPIGGELSSSSAGGGGPSVIPLSAEASPASYCGEADIARFKVKKQQQTSSFPPPRATCASKKKCAGKSPEKGPKNPLAELKKA